VSTGNDKDASTTSHVSIMLIGTKGSTDYTVLGLPDRSTGFTFTRAKTKIFDVSMQYNNNINFFVRNLLVFNFI